MREQQHHHHRVTVVEVGNVLRACHPVSPPLFLDVGLVAREGGHLHVDVLEGDRVDGARDAVDVGRVGHRLSEDGWFDGRAHQSRI